MKKLCLVPVIFVFLLAVNYRTLGQTSQPKLDQLKLMQQFIGKWQSNFRDTISSFELRQYGKSFIEDDYITLNGKETPDSKWSYSYSPGEDKFKIFAVYVNGKYQTLTGSFTSEKKWVQEVVQDLNPEKVLFRVEMVFDTPSSMTVTAFDAKGSVLFELKSNKVK